MIRHASMPPIWNEVSKDMNGYWFDWRRHAARRAARLREHERRRAEERRTWMDAAVAAATALGLALALLMGLTVEASWGASPYSSIQQTASNGTATQTKDMSPDVQETLLPVDFTDLTMLEERSTSRCSARYGWPVSNPVVEAPFDRPLTPWAPGHRGIDVKARQGDSISAPAAGTISFAGKVGGKDVVSLRHRGGVTSTFEPAVTTLEVGMNVNGGASIGVVDGESDHCSIRQCLHWGLKRGAHDYLDPERYVGEYMIVLKE
ncbi:M23 family metallopeptidase [Bifidobacterium reuteri]|nr:M23 family metallopeptidase [Bifidobacterium reuteri]